MVTVLFNVPYIKKKLQKLCRIQCTDRIRCVCLLTCMKIYVIQFLLFNNYVKLPFLKCKVGGKPANDHSMGGGHHHPWTNTD